MSAAGPGPEPVLQVSPGGLLQGGVNLQRTAQEAATAYAELKDLAVHCAYAGGTGDDFAEAWDTVVNPTMLAGLGVLKAISGLLDSFGSDVADLSKLFGAADDAATADAAQSTGVVGKKG